MKCRVFIDESGEAGIRKIRSENQKGASPYFVLAAAVMPSDTLKVAGELLAKVENEFGKPWKHATDLNHSQTVYFCREASKLNLRFFAVVSKKSSLGSYAQEIAGDSHKFYNKCTQYLLERVGGYLNAKGMDADPDVIFEGRNHDFDALRRFVGKVKDTPFDSRAKNLRIFNPFGFVERAKHEEKLLKYADLVAHSVYQCVNKTPSNYCIPEPRYLSELQNRFGADEKGKVLGEGLKCIHSIDSVAPDPDVRRVWESLKAVPRVKSR